MKKIISIAALLTLSGCASTPPFDWHEHVLPLQNGEYLAKVDRDDEKEAADIALKAVYAACGDLRPAILSRANTRTGNMSETADSVLEGARYAVAAFGIYTPDVSNQKYHAEYRFKCVAN